MPTPETGPAPGPDPSVSSWISIRQAARILGAARGLTYERSRRVLAAGLAGPPIRTSAAVLHAEERVRELAARPLANAADLVHGCPDGVLVVRLAHHRTVDVGLPWEAQAQMLSGGWPISELAAVEILLEAEAAEGATGTMPFLATVCGFVAFGAQARPRRFAAHLDLHLDLTPPGAWFERFEGTYLPTPPGKEWLQCGRRWRERFTRPPRGPSLASTRHGPAG